MLKALCYRLKNLGDEAVSYTMTGIYGAIELRLYKEDVERLEKDISIQKQQTRALETQRSVESEIKL